MGHIINPLLVSFILPSSRFVHGIRATPFLAIQWMTENSKIVYGASSVNSSSHATIYSLGNRYFGWIVNSRSQPREIGSGRKYLGKKVHRESDVLHNDELSDPFRPTVNTKSNIKAITGGAMPSLFRSVAPRPKFVHPPVPKSLSGGHILDIEILKTRNEHAKVIIEGTVQIISDDVDNSIDNAKMIPVAAHGERVMVSTETYDLINQTRAKKDISKNIRRNINEIEKMLLYRQKVLDLMNQNSDGVEVKNTVAPLRG